jgi:hypothetical protein
VKKVDRRRKPVSGYGRILRSSVPALGLALGAGLLYGQFAAPETDTAVVSASLAPQAFTTPKSIAALRASSGQSVAIKSSVASSAVPALDTSAAPTPAPAPSANAPDRQWVGESRVARAFDRLLDTTSALGPQPASFAERLSGDSSFAPSEPAASFAERFPSMWAKAPAEEKAAVAAQIAPHAPKPSIVLASADTAAVPVPRARPAEARQAERDAEAGPSRRDVSRENASVALATAPSEQPSLFQKLFGTNANGPVLAYAPSDGGIPGLTSRNAALAGVDRTTAVYDITAKTVYMPDGTKLEAHSGLGSRLDDPRYVHERMKGATPPHVYDLTMRESLFHGVAAIRLNPVGGESNIHGRTGLLAHTYMLGPNGDSNGCVSFRNYDAFLRAFKNGEVKRLVVVAKL